MRLHVALLIAAIATPALAVAEPPSRAELQVLARHQHAEEQLIALGRLAQQQGKSPGVQEFAARLVRDHARNLAALDAFAHDQHVTLPMVAPESLGRLRAASGAEFDRLFLDRVIEHHDRALASLDADIAMVKHAKLRRQLRALRPVLQRELAQARMLDESNAQAMGAPPPRRTRVHAPRGS